MATRETSGSGVLVETAMPADHAAARERAQDALAWIDGTEDEEGPWLTDARPLARDVLALLADLEQRDSWWKAEKQEHSETILALKDEYRKGYDMGFRQAMGAIEQAVERELELHSRMSTVPEVE